MNFTTLLKSSFVSNVSIKRHTEITTFSIANINLTLYEANEERFNHFIK
jgi:hypothetical protein